MLYQIELTTNCNLNCFYCPSSSLEKVNMSFDVFKNIIDNINYPSHIKLQGTGEALLHPEFDRFVKYAKQKGHFTEIITNGTLRITDDRLSYLDSVGFSIDTLDKKQADKSGRKHLDQIVKNLLEIYEKAPQKCKVFSVYYGQEINQLHNFTKHYKIPHIIQNIQNKTSYQLNYTVQKSAYLRYSCSYINNNKIKFYFVDGRVAPCPYIVDVKQVLRKEDILKMFSKCIVPKCCEQCDELVGKNRLLLKKSPNKF